MTKGLYLSLMHYYNTHRKEFRNIMDTGCFYFEGMNDYETKLIVISVGNGSDIISSHIPIVYLPKLVTEEEITKKGKLSTRGPGNAEFKSVKTAAVLSKAPTEIAIQTINTTLTEYSTKKRNQIVEFTIESIKKQFNMHYKNQVDESEVNNKIDYVLKEYLGRSLRAPVFGKVGIGFQLNFRPTQGFPIFPISDSVRIGFLGVFPTEMLSEIENRKFN